MTQVRKTMLTTKVRVNENERALVLKNGQFDRILTPGKSKLWGWAHDYEIYGFNLAQPIFISEYTKALLKDRPDIVAAHLSVIETGPDEIAIIYRDGQLFAVQKPELKSVFWTDAGPWTIERFNAAKDLQVSAPIAKRIGRIRDNAMRTFAIAHGQTGLLFIDNVLTKTLMPGVYAFWDVGRNIDVKIVDMRTHALDVTGQEILTKDRVSLRVNLSATYRVVDPVQAITAVKDYADTLYRALQYAFRQALALRTLDEVLAKKGRVDVEAAKTVKTAMADIGIEVAAITIKDVVLPGEMRDILNMVVSAQKEAEANVIRRREETNATRALLNTAKVMQDNPAMLRLKELEALETIAAKVGQLTVLNGTAGLLDDIVSLKVPQA